MFGGAGRKNSQHLRFEEFVPSSGWTDDSDSYCLIIDLPGFKREQVKLQIDNYGQIVASGERQVNEYKHIRFEQSFKVPENSDIEDTTAKFEDEILYIVVPKKIKAEKEPRHEISNIPEAIQEQKGTGHSAETKLPESVSEEDIKGKDRHTDAAANNHSNEGKDKYMDEAENGRQENESYSNKHSNEKINDEEKDKHDDDDDEEVTEESHDAEIEKQRYERSLAENLRKELKKNKGILITAFLAFSFGVWVSQRFQADEN